MKRIFFVFGLFFASVALMAGNNFTPGSYVYIDITNSDNFARKDCPIVLKVKDIISQFKHYNGERIGLFDGKKEIHSQFDDLDHDGKADEAAFLVNLKPNEKIRIMARKLPVSYPEPNFTKEVYAEMIRKVKNADGKTDFVMVDSASSTKDDMYNQMHHHGVAFETDIMAYRLYFDKKQTVDVYGKKTPRLEIAESQWYPTDEQLARGFGDDVLLVKGSVGVGTFKGWNGEALHFDSVALRKQRIVATGTLRNVVEIDVTGWKYDGKSIDVVIRYIQYARHRDVEAQVYLKGCTPDMVYCTGVQKMAENATYYDKENLVGVWGTGFPVNDTVKYGKETVGLAVAVPLENYNGMAQDKRNHLVLLKAQENEPITYYLTTVSTKEKGGIKEPAVFFSYLDQWKKEVLSPVEVTVSLK